MKSKQCPKCRKRQTTDYRDGGYYCHNCRMEFDDDSDEGGTYYNDPTRRIEREEERGRR